MKKIPLILFAIGSLGGFLPEYGPLVVTGIGFASLIMYANFKKFELFMKGNLTASSEKKLVQSKGENTFMKSCIALTFGGIVAIVAKIIYWNIC